MSRNINIFLKVPSSLSPAMALSESTAEFGQPDFILVDEISEEAFMANLKKRYERGKVCLSASLGPRLSSSVLCCKRRKAE